MMDLNKKLGNNTKLVNRAASPMNKAFQIDMS